MSDLRFRTAGPGDAGVVVPLMVRASPDLVPTVFGTAAEGFLAYDFHRGRGIYGHLGQTVAEDAVGRVVATITAYPGGRAQALTLRTVLSALRYFGPLRFPGVARRMAAVGRLFTPPSPDAVFLANLCVADGLRSRGYGALLIDHVTGGGPAELDVSHGNERAQRLYERLGFTVVSSREAPDGTGFRRMRRP